MNQKEFYRLYNIWKDETRFLSHHNTDHIAFKKIVDMGKDIIPLLLSNLWDSWLPIIALRQILGKAPFEVLPEDRGRFDILNQKWYDWGQTQGYI
jgi:hypothetical protein